MRFLARPRLARAHGIRGVAARTDSLPVVADYLASLLLRLGGRRWRGSRRAQSLGDHVDCVAQKPSAFNELVDLTERGTSLLAVAVLQRLVRVSKQALDRDVSSIRWRDFAQ